MIAVGAASPTRPAPRWAGPGPAPTGTLGRPRVVVVVGTRPEVLKLAPVVRGLRCAVGLEVMVVSTGQHREILDRAVADAGIEVDADLGVMAAEQSLAGLTARVLEEMTAALADLDPAVVVVQGDTTSAFAAALAAFYAGVPVAHVEAGLRTAQVRDPFPEELNRRLISRIASVHFCPTVRAAEALLAEGTPPADVIVTGNTVVDQLHWTAAHRPGRPLFETALTRVLVTLHRRETQGPVMAGMAEVIAETARGGDVEVVVVLHPSPSVRRVLIPVLAGCEGVRLVEPLGHADFTRALRDCDLVLTDSGGVQEEAPSFAKPVIVLREVTERAEGIQAGAATLVGTDPDALRTAIRAHLDPGRPQPTGANPYGDGRAAQRIITELHRRHGRIDACAPRSVQTAATVAPTSRGVRNVWHD